MENSMKVPLRSNFLSPKGPIILSITDQNELNASLKRNPRKEGENVLIEQLLNVPIVEILAVYYHRGPIKASLDPLNDNWNLALSEREIQFVNEFVEEKHLDNAQKCWNCGHNQFKIDADTASLVIYSVKRKWRDPNLWRIQISHFTCETDLISCRDWKLELSNRIAGFKRPKFLLTFVNPFGGKRKAPKIYQKYLKPILKLCDISENLIMTERANHAKEYLQEADLSRFDGVICVGGDGMFNEVLSGLVLRCQREFQIDINDRNSRFQRIPLRIGIIPAGSTNALGNTSQGNCDFATAAMHIAIGDEIGVDVCSIHSGSGLLRLASTATSYGFLGEVLRESEELRAFGPTRYTIAGLKVICQHPSFRGSVKFLPAAEEIISAGEKLKKCRSGCTLCSTIFPSENPPSEIKQTPTFPPWVEIRDDFVHLVGLVTACVSYRSPQGLWPPVHLGDGTCDIAMAGKISRCANMAFVGRIMTPGSDHTNFESIRVFRVSEFSFTPITALEADFSDSIAPGDESGQSRGENFNLAPKLGSWNVDGEIMRQTDETFHFKVHRQLIRLFARGIEG